MRAGPTPRDLMTLLPLRRLIVPILLLAAAAVILDPVRGLAPVYLQLLDWLPYGTLAIALVLSAWFNQSRLFTATLAMLVLYHFIRTTLQVSLADPHALLIYTLISVAAPLLLLLLFFLPERGLRNRYGAMMVCTVPIMTAAVALAVNYLAARAADFIALYFAIKPHGGYVLSVNASAGFAVVLLVGLWRLCRHDSEYLSALAVSLLFVFVTLAFFDQMKISTIMLGMAGVNMVISMVRSSYDMAYRDELTGLPGRRALNERLKGLGSRYVIAMMDVDHFKKFNDTYGHDTGDEVLKMVARQIGAVQGGGTAYRFGGEEFCIVFTGKDTDQCGPFLEAVRTSVENYRMAVRDSKQRKIPGKVARERRGRRARSRNGRTVSVTISIGAAQPNNNRQSVEKVLKAADTALYRAKKNGRNCLCMA